MLSNTYSEAAISEMTCERDSTSHFETPWSHGNGFGMGFFTSHYNQRRKIVGNARTCLHVDGQIEYSQCQDYALHLVEPARCGVICAVETNWNHHSELVSNAIDAFEPSIEGETVTVLREIWQSYPPTWQYSAICRKTGQDILGNAEMAHQHLRSYEEVIKWIDSKDASFFPDGILQLPERWKKSNG